MQDSSSPLTELSSIEENSNGRIPAAATPPLQMEGGHANIEAFNQTPISADEVLFAIGHEGLNELFGALVEDGLAHLLRGNKPVFWLEDTFEIIEQLLDAGYQLKPEFALVPDSENNAFLISRTKLLAHIENNKNRYEQLMFNGAETPAISIHEQLLNQLPDPYNPDVGNQTLLGGVLHYGFENGAMYARLNDPEVGEDEKQHIRLMQMPLPATPQAAEIEDRDYIIRAPSYLAWPNQESIALRTMQSNDCQVIQDSLAHIAGDFRLHATTAFVNDFMKRA